ncbi:polysaccharide deacetylase family protein [Halieaceae bacterium IMCC14734]|uniref:Polysaccharide deacetylase family protein n=1 Tax=Candidatus Litorirhabdus singularis TaxID=2518993 RepID=A0ABT3TBI0_9GAMM|nr:polysaccharide deacetylase family protein [Candidatus Litorirhabdus singularis]MCX2979641.1 polysaccharide deacetylase family protein [Candidatus Litorirhabdus singularis]
MLIRLGIGFTVALVILVLAAVWSYRDVAIWPQVGEKVVALTFDDGPNPPHTQALLRELESAQVSATFFMKGANAEAFPELVRAVAAAGHEVGNHSFYHRPMLALGSAAYVEELQRTNRALESALGYLPHLFRPPYGLQGIGLTNALKKLELRSIAMGVHGSDWSEKDAGLITDAILADIKPGAIVLLHDGHADVADPDAQDSRAATVAATRALIVALRADGYRFLTVSELLALEQQ